MKRSNRLMLLVGVLLAVVAFGGVLMFGSRPGGQGGPEAPPQVVTVVTAATDLTLGTRLEPTDLATRELPVDEAFDTFRDPTVVTNQILRRAVTAGQVLTSADFQSGNASALDVTRGLKPGQRAMAVRVDSLSGVGSLIQAGDYVDVMLAITDQPDPNKAPVVGEFRSEGGLPVTKIDDSWLNTTTIKVLVQNVQVLGTILPTVATEPRSNGEEESGSIALLALTPQQAELVRFTQLDGNLYLLLRSPEDELAADVPTTGITLRELTDRWGVLPPRVIISRLP